MELNTLFTIGYEAKSVESFSKAIQDRDISLLIDVRNVAISRKPGFSKTALSNVLSDNNIDYLHIRELGAPKPIRYKFYNDKDFKEFKKAYKHHLKTTNGSLNKIIDLLKEKAACLLCFESTAENCHRSILAEEIIKATQNKVTVEHI